MSFTSISYYVFLPVIYLLFYWSHDQWRWMVLLIASYGFYASFKAPYLLAALLTSTGISYACGLRMAAQRDDAIRKRWLCFGSFSCVAILALLKYLPFFESYAASFGFNTPLSLPIISIGVSYFTFQAISYLADIYLEVEEPEHHLGYYALYLSFFPKLMQGPIERPGTLLPQLREPYQFDYDAMRSGMLLFAWGLFKKVVIADRMAVYADLVFNNVHDFKGLSVILGIYAFSFQIYYDFAGYTDMARGTARMFGIKLSENFNNPYMATSIADFWRRWHISFSRWILDYIFKPLQMKWRNLNQTGTALALIFTFLVSGVWHGASWGFVVWGLLHGIYLASSTYYRPYKKRLHKWLGVEKHNGLKWWQVFVTFNLVSFAWVFFRAKNLSSAWLLIQNLSSNDFLKTTNKLFANTGMNLIILFISLIIILSISFLKDKYIEFYKFNAITRLIIYILLMVGISLFAYTKQYNFIYNQF